jgi:hypothetical protein
MNEEIKKLRNEGIKSNYELKIMNYKMLITKL